MNLRSIGFLVPFIRMKQNETKNLLLKMFYSQFLRLNDFRIYHTMKSQSSIIVFLELKNPHLCKSVKSVRLLPKHLFICPKLCKFTVATLMHFTVLSQPKKSHKFIIFERIKIN